MSTSIRQWGSLARVSRIVAAKMAASLLAGHPVTLDRTESIADGLMPVRPGDLTFEHVTAFVDAVVAVTEQEIARAALWLFSEAKQVVEPSGAVSAQIGVVSQGQGHLTTVAQVLADELGVPLESVRVHAGDTAAARTPGRVSRAAKLPTRHPAREDRGPQRRRRPS